MDAHLYFDLFLNSEDSDFTAHVETLNETRLVFPVHSFVLERSSEVFKIMMEKDKFKEGATKVLEIIVPGDEEEAITFFRYLYTRKLGNLDIPSYIVLLQLAHLYEVHRLAVSCESRIKELVTPFSVCRVYLSLEMVATDDFLMYCKNMMLTFAFLIFMDNLHIILNEDTMKFLLESDQLVLLDEEQAVGALWMWARTNCLCETKVTEETFKVSLDKLKPLIRWSKITNAMDAPWFQLIEENKKLSGTNEKARCSYRDISLKQFSETLNRVDFKRTYWDLQRRYAIQDFWAFDLLFNPKNNDFEAHVEIQSSGEQLVIPVHSLILIRASDVFKAMIEKNQFQEGVTKVIQIKIPGDEVNVKILIRYLYTMKLGKLDIRSYIAFMQVAHRYEIRSLLQLCEKRIVDALTPFSVCRVYCCLEKIVSDNTLTLCKDIMLRYAFIPFTEHFHLVLTEETLKFLLQSDELKLLNEEQAPSALWSWTCTKCLLESPKSKGIVGYTLEKFLYLVRWPMINFTEIDAPWVRGKEHLTGNEIEDPVSSNNIYLKQYSNALVFSRSNYFYKTVSLKRKQELIDIDISSDVLLTGLKIILKHCCLSDFNLMVNNNNVTSNIIRNELQIRTIDHTFWSVSRMTLEFTKPILLSSLSSNKIVFSADCGVVFPRYYGDHYKKYENSDSGRVLNFQVHGHVIGIQKLYYMIWK